MRVKMSLGRSVGGRSIKALKIRRRSVVSIAKVRKMAKKEFPSIDLLRVAPDLIGHSLYKGQKIFFTMRTYWVSKDAVISEKKMQKMTF